MKRKAGAKKILLVSRYLAVDGVSGHNAYLKAVVDGIRAEGHRVCFFWLDGPWFCRPFFRIPRSAVQVDQLISPRALIWGGFAFSGQRKVWLGFFRQIAATALMRVSPRGFRTTLSEIKARAWDAIETSNAPFGNISVPSAREKGSFEKRCRLLVPDFVILNYAHLGELAGISRKRETPVAIITHDIVHQLEETLHARGGGRDRVTAAEEVRRLEKADLIVAIQKNEAADLQRMLPSHRIITVPMPHAIVQSERRQARPNLLFVGGISFANSDGINWFLNSVWKLVVEKIPDARLRICGNVCSQVASAPASVELVGRVDELDSYYANATACIIPLLAGSGLKIKLVEALCHGRAVVSTSIGLQGAEELEGRCVLRADAASDFAEAAIRILTDENLRRRMESEAHEAARRNFRPEASLRPLIAWLDESRPGTSVDLSPA